jgi:hypothetical protein
VIVVSTNLYTLLQPIHLLWFEFFTFAEKFVSSLLPFGVLLRLSHEPELVEQDLRTFAAEVALGVISYYAPYNPLRAHCQCEPERLDGSLASRRTPLQIIHFTFSPE